jgi:hypothetical protein
VASVTGGRSVIGKGECVALAAKAGHIMAVDIDQATIEETLEQLPSSALGLLLDVFGTKPPWRRWPIVLCLDSAVLTSLYILQEYSDLRVNRLKLVGDLTAQEWDTVVDTKS